MSPTQPETLCNHIAGGFVPPVGDRYMHNVDPATGQVLSRIPRSDADDVNHAVTAAQLALKGPWGKTTPDDRADVLERIANGIEARLDELALLESEDTGKPIALAKRIDIPRAVANFRFFSRAIRSRGTEMHEMAGAINYTLCRPVGVCALITPWNLPLYLLTWKTAPALAMGNTIVAKPSEMTPRTAGALADIMAKAGLPAGVFNLVHGLGPECGAPLVAHAGVNAVSFTGGTETGKHVARAAAPGFKKLSLELGGKNPTIVFADADFETAVDGAVRAAFTNQGQICLCGSRILVERSIHDAFVESMVEKVKQMNLGDPRNPATALGSLISQDHRAKVQSYLTLAEEEGGEIRCGGKQPNLNPPFSSGAFLEPAIITGLPANSRTATEEIFGPVVTVHPFDDESDAVSKANCVRYGLSASVWTKDLTRAHRISAALETGMVWINTWLLRDLRVPFGGVKDSGVGREGGEYSLKFFSEQRNVCIKL